MDRVPPVENQTRTSIFTAMGWGLVGLALIFVLASLVWHRSPGSAMLSNSAGGDGPAWQSDLDQAMVQAKAQNRPLLLDFTAGWCPPCQEMARSVWPDKAVKELIDGGFTPIKIDLTDAGGPNQSTAQRMGVSAIPTLVVLSPQGKELDRRVGGMNASAMHAWLKGLAPMSNFVQP